MHSRKFTLLFLTLIYLRYIYDLYASFGFHNMVVPMTKKVNPMVRVSQVYRRGALKGRLFYNKREYVLFDISGLLGKMSLENVARAVGVTMANKHSLDPYKASMDRALLHDDVLTRNQFFHYAMDDCVVLHKILDQRIMQHNHLMELCLGLHKKHHFTLDNFPKTLGTLVPSVFGKL